MILNNITKNENYECYEWTEEHKQNSGSMVYII